MHRIDSLPSCKAQYTWEQGRWTKAAGGGVRASKGFFSSKGPEICHTLEPIHTTEKNTYTIAKYGTKRHDNNDDNADDDDDNEDDDDDDDDDEDDDEDDEDDDDDDDDDDDADDADDADEDDGEDEGGRGGALTLDISRIRRRPPP